MTQPEINPNTGTNIVPWARNAYVDRAQAQAAAVNSYGGGSGGDGMDAWQTSVESRLGQLHSDVSSLRTDLNGRIDGLSDRVDSNFKWLLGIYGAGFLTLAGMIIVGYLKLSDQIGDVAKAVAALHH